MPVSADRPLRPVHSHRDLVGLTHGDPFVRWGVPDPFQGVVLAGRGAVAVERMSTRRHGMWLIPLPDPDPESGLDDLLSRLRGEDRVARLGVRGLSVPQPYAGVLAAHFDLAGGGEWDWMWTTTAPGPTPGEEDLVELDDRADAAELTDFSIRHSPTGEGDPGTGLTRLWIGLRDRSGALVAAGGVQHLASGAPHLAGIVVHGSHRGRGLGRAVTAALTRRALTTHEVCTLGVYSANRSALALYRALGYRTAYAWHSRTLA